MVPGSFGLAFSTSVCAANMCVEIFLLELEASLSSASASLPFTLGVVTVSASAFVSSSTSVSSSALTVSCSASTAVVTLVDLGLEIGDGGHECLHLCHNVYVLFGIYCDAVEVLLQLLFSLLFGGL